MEIADEQAGFRQGRGTRDQITNLTTRPKLRWVGSIAAGVGKLGVALAVALKKILVFG